MRPYIPKVVVARQSQVTTPTTTDATLVNDTVQLVDSTTVLSGGPNTPTSTPHTTISTLVPSIKLKIMR